jgi:hypothetical protein
MIEILEQAMELYEKERKLRKESVKENVTPKVSLEPTIRSKRSRDDDVAEENNIVSKKRKFDQ